MVKDFDIVNKVDKLRKEITKIDYQIIFFIAHRMKVACEIGQCKKELKINIVQKKYWNNLVKDRISVAKDKGLSEEFIIELFNALHQESIRNQK